MDTEERLVAEAIVFKLLALPAEVRTSELEKIKQGNPELAEAVKRACLAVKEKARG